MKKTTLSILLVMIGLMCQAQSVFINEIHYDNAGGDVGESVEIAGPAGTDLSTYSIVLYNGSNGTSYNTVTLSGSIDDEGSGFGAIAQPISGMQNGAPDGIALLDGGAVVQFLSYEGSFTATNGPANGQTSIDIGVNETSGTPVGESLQLTGTGTLYTDFVWNAPAAESPGVINVGQTFSGGGVGSPPVIACPADASANVISGTCGAIVTFADAVATDPDGDLDTVTQTGGLTSGSTFPVGISTIQFTATDLEGNTASCTFTITVIDNEAPVAVCQNLTAELDPVSGTVTIDPASIDNGSTDNCGIASFSLDITTFDCSNVGVNTITFTVTDDSGNIDTCTTEITIEDNTAPEIVCIGETSTGTPVFINEIHYDNSGGDVDEAIEIAGPAGTDLSTYTITLYNGNGGTEYNEIPLTGSIDDEGAGFGAVNFLISGIQNGAPDGIALSESGNVIQFLSYEGSFTAADGIASGLTSTDIGVSESSATAIGESMQLTGTGMFYENFTWTAPLANTYGDVNTGQTFIMQTVTPLEVVLDANGMASIDPSDLIQSVNEACGFTVTTGVATSTDILVNGSFETGDLSGWTAIDNPSPFLPWGAYPDNSGNGFFDPALPTDGALLAGNGFDGDIGEAILYQDVTIPAGLTATLSWDENLDYNLLDFCNGCSNRIYEVQVRDLSDNVLEVLTGVTATAGVLENDNAWVSQTADLSAYAGQDIRIAYWQNIPELATGPAKFALDNVALMVDGTVQENTVNLDCSNIGENQIEITVTDNSGNTATCLASVTVTDETAPVLVCADATIELGEDGTAVVDPEALLAQMPGTFEVITISSDNQSGAVGNTDFTVAVTADETVSFDWDYSTDDGAAFDGFGYLLNGVFTELTDQAGANNQTGNTSVTLVTGDVFGFRSASVDGLFGASTTVISNFMPGFTGQFEPANWTLDLDNSDGDAFFAEIPGGPLSFDACGITVLAVDVTEVTCADIGTPITVTVFASDASGNIAACTATVTVVDALGPVIACPADQTVDPGEGNLFYEVPDYFATGEATVTDNCTDPVTITSQDPAVGELISDGVYTVTLTAEDEYGNTSECSFELTVESILGLDDNKLDSAIAMYPNPTQSNVTISNSSNIALDKAAIYDTNGRLISTTDLSEMQQEKTIDVSNLATGVYMVQIQGENAITVKRLIKE